MGRDVELDRVQGALDDVLGGRGRVVLVSGEPGIGKTRLVEELAALAEDRGALVAWGHVDDVDGAPPYWPWLQVLDGVLERADRDTVEGALAVDAGPISAIAPAVAQFVAGNVLPPPPLDPAAARFRLHRAVSGFLGRVGAQRPLVVVLDDMHWADVSSLELIRFLAAEQATAALLLVLTYRSVDGGDTAALDDVLASLARAPALERIALDGLSEPEVGHFMAQTIGLRPRRSAVTSVHARTEGNPFFVAELARLLQSEGLLHAPDGQQHDAVPAGVRDVLRRRLGRLPRETRDVLTLGAVLGRDFELSMLADCSGCGELAAAELVEPALAAGLLRLDTGNARMRFSHALVRETIYGELSALRRATLHAQAGSALEQRRDRGSLHLAELAQHFFHAAPVLGPEQGLDYTLRAAKAAESSLAYERAEDDLRRALTLVEQLPDRADRAPRELDVQNRLVVLLTGSQGMAAPAVGRACARARELCEQIAESDGVFNALHNLCAFHVVRADLAVAAEFAGQLLAIGRRRRNATWVMTGHVMVGVSQTFAGRLAAARESFASARAAACELEFSVELAQACMGVHPLSNCLIHDARCAWLMGDAAGAEALAAEGVAVAMRVGAPYGVGFALYYTTMLHSLAGDAATTLTWCERAIGYCEEHGQASVMPWFRVFRAWATSEQGQADEAIGEITAAANDSRAAGSRINIPIFNGLIADVEVRRGNLGRALEVIEDALAGVREDQIWVSDLHRRRADLLAAHGSDHTVAAADAFRTAISVAESQGAIVFARRAIAELERIQPTAAVIQQEQQSNLSSRERELLSLVGRGLTDKEIAAELVISLATVRSHWTVSATRPVGAADPSSRGSRSSSGCRRGDRTPATHNVDRRR